MPHDPATITAAVVIATKNRRDDLRNALISVMNQTAKAEVVVIDDGSEDDTAGMVRSEFPGVHVERGKKSLGYIAQRNRGAMLAKSDVVFSIDDDAIFPSPRTIEQTLAEFDRPRIGAVAVPFINVRQDFRVWQMAPDDKEIYVVERYIGTAHAVRRELFNSIGGYRAELIHQGEEGDFCLRMLAGGHVVRAGRADPIHHFESPRRSLARMDFYGRRNDILYVWHNVPQPMFFVHLAGTTLLGLGQAVRTGRPVGMLRGLASGYIDSVRRWKMRKPVERGVYRLSRRIKAAGMMRLGEIEAFLPVV